MQNPVKAILRKNIKNVLKEMSMEDKQKQSKLVMKKLFNLSDFKSSARISIYLSTENEVNTIPILSQLFKQQKQVFVPSYFGSEMKMLKLCGMEDFESLPLTKWKIKQPNPDDNRENPMMTTPLDIIIMPGVAFTSTGDRLGHGMGFYDKYLQAYFDRYPNNNQHKTHLIGLAFNEQIIDDLPVENTDWKLDLIINGQ